MERFGIKLAVGIALILCSVTGAIAQSIPTEVSAYRPLRSDYVKSWNLYSDVNSNGILDPSDGTTVADFGNWWSWQGSAEHQIQMTSPSAPWSDTDSPNLPMNFASSTDPYDNYWLTQKKDRLGMYMYYGQWDNNTAAWNAAQNEPTFGSAKGDLYAEQNTGKNGWALAWVTNNNDTSASSDIVGYNFMDVYIHNGKYIGDVPEYGTNPQGTSSISNPLVTMSNDIMWKAKDALTGAKFVPQWNEATQSYDIDANMYREIWQELWTGTDYTAADLQDIVDSMKIQERNPWDTTDWDPINSDLTPDQILAALNYVYDDAFTDRGGYTEHASDGGVIGGLSGRVDGAAYDEQQVVRIDFGDFTATYADLGMTPPSGKSATDLVFTLDEVVFYDFGDSGMDPAQTNPFELVFQIDRSRTYEDGQLWFDANGDGLFSLADGDMYFAQNRIFIGLNDPVVPEPGTMILLAAGGAGLVWKQRRNRLRMKAMAI
jgi:hypothetical protein